MTYEELKNRLIQRGFTVSATKDGDTYLAYKTYDTRYESVLYSAEFGIDVEGTPYRCGDGFSLDNNEKCTKKQTEESMETIAVMWCDDLEYIGGGLGND